MIKWFWTIFSLGAPENTQLHAKVAPLRRKQQGLTMHLLGKSPIIPQVIFSMSARALENKSQQKSGRAIALPASSPPGSLEKLLLSKTVQLVTFIVKDYTPYSQMADTQEKTGA